MSRDEWLTPAEISKHVRVTAGTVVYHLKNMEREKIVEHEPEGIRWRLGPYNQTTLTRFLIKKERKRQKKK